MDASDLRIFAMVAKYGGMNRAATALNTVQSNVTARIRSLESDLGVPVFVRSSRGVVLTSAGERLLPYAARVSGLLAEAARAARDDGTPRGPLCIGSLETTAALRLTPLLARYVAKFPEVDFMLKTGTSRELVEQVLARQIDGAFVCGPVDHPALEYETMFREELVLLSPPGMTAIDEYLAGRNVKIVVLRLGCSYRLLLEDWLARRGVVGLRHLEFGTLEAVIGCVSAGLGITLLPKALIGPVWRDGRVGVHALRDAAAQVETVFIRRGGEVRSSAIEAFLAMARPSLSVLSAAE
ncbi:MAG: LysR family transcriptional regulator [Proteobacteria bacterium]|nr:LysR family transcriptional regulator [Pseudomonadota bacterium]